MQTLAARIMRADGLAAQDVVGWIIRLAKTLEPIHDLGVAHGAICADAIQLEGSSPTARGHILTPRHLRDLPAYHSPERAIGEGASPEDDTWATAVTLYFGLTRSVPFAGSTDREVRQRIVSSRPPPLAAFGIDDDRLQVVFDRAFSRDVLERITSLSSLREALEEWHPDPEAKELPALWHEGSLLLALCPAPGGDERASSPRLTPQVPVPAAALQAAKGPSGGRPPVIHEDMEEDDDGPTRVRDVPTLLAQLAALEKSEPPGPPSPAGAQPTSAQTANAQSTNAQAANAQAANAQAANTRAANAQANAANAQAASAHIVAANALQAAHAQAHPSHTQGASGAVQAVAAEIAHAVVQPRRAQAVVAQPVAAQVIAAPVAAQPVATPVAAQPVAAPLTATVVMTAQAPVPAEEPPPVSAPILPFDRESAPPNMPVPAMPEPFPTRIREERPSAPILPFDRESAPPRSVPTGAAAIAQAAPPAQAAAAVPTPIAIAPLAPMPPAKGRSPLPIVVGLLVIGAAGGVAFFLTRPPAGSGNNPSSGAPQGSTITALHGSTSATGPGTAEPTGAVATNPAIAASATASSAAGAPSGGASAAPNASASAAPTASATAEPAATAKATAAPANSAAATATATSEPAAGGSSGAAACLLPLFPNGTFVSAPAALDQACQITDPREGVKLFKTQVTLAGAGRLVSDGMREWAIIGWYGIPAFTAMRATCCPSAPDIHIGYRIPSCDLESATKRLSAVASSATATDAEVTEALQAYTKMVICTADSGAAGAFGQKGGIVEGELVTFNKTLARVRAAAKNK